MGTQTELEALRLAADQLRKVCTRLWRTSQGGCLHLILLRQCCYCVAVALFTFHCEYYSISQLGAQGLETHEVARVGLQALQLSAPRLLLEKLLWMPDQYGQAHCACVCRARIQCSTQTSWTASAAGWAHSTRLTGESTPHGKLGRKTVMTLVANPAVLDWHYGKCGILALGGKALFFSQPTHCTASAAPC